MQARIVDQVVKDRNISRAQPFKNVPTAKGHTQPQSFRPRTGKERAAGKAFRVDRIVHVEVPHIADMLDVIEKKGDDSARKVKQVDPVIAHEGRQGQVPRKRLSREAPNDYLFVGGGHGAPGLSHERTGRREKGATPVANTPMLCYTYVLCLRVKILINT
jgi:hypothetical protein